MPAGKRAFPRNDGEFGMRRSFPQQQKRSSQAVRWRRELHPKARTLKRGAPLLLALTVVGAAFAACGGSAGPGVASIGPHGTTTAPSSSGSSSSQSASTLTRALKYAQCMRTHGVPNFPDPTSGPSGNVSFSLRGSVPRPQLLAAQKVCQSLMGGGLITSAEKAAANAKALKYAQCMRTHGVPNFPDPNGQGLIKITPATNVAIGSSLYDKAQRHCQSLFNGFDEMTQGGPSPSS